MILKETRKYTMHGLLKKFDKKQMILQANNNYDKKRLPFFR